MGAEAAAQIDRIAKRKGLSDHRLAKLFIAPSVVVMALVALFR